MKSWLQITEVTSTYLSLLLMVALSVNLAIFHDIGSSSQTRFLFSGALLVGLTFFLRFGLKRIEILQKTTYRIALVMMLWSFSFYFFSSQDWVLSVISLPAFYFLWRVEMKSESKVSEDVVSAGILLCLGSLLYIQQQPLKVLLYPEIDFQWQNYFKHSWLLIGLGVGYLRLNHRLHWPGITLVAITHLYIGFSMYSYWLLNERVSFVEFAYVSIFWGHLFIFLFCNNSRVQQFLINSCGLEHHYRVDFSNFCYWLCNILMVIAVIHLLEMNGLSIISLLTMAIALTGLMYLHRPTSVSVVFIFLCIGCLFIGEQAHLEDLIYWQLAILTLLALMLIARVKNIIGFTVPHSVWGAGAIIYYVLLLTGDILSLLGFLMILGPVALWWLLPDKPYNLPRKIQWIQIPIILAIGILCFDGGLQYHFWTKLSLANSVFTIVIFMTLNYFFHTTYESAFDSNSDSKLEEMRAGILLDWFSRKQNTLLKQIGLSFIASSVGVLLVQQQLIEDNLLLSFSLIVLVLGFVQLIYLVSLAPFLRLVLFAELHVLSILMLIRMKFDSLGFIELGSSADGYWIMALSLFIAGLREVLRNVAPQFTKHLSMVTLVMAVLGWGVLISSAILYPTGHNDWFRPELIISALVMAVFFWWQAKTQSKSYYWLVIIFINLAFFIFTLHQGYHHVIYVLLPIGLSLLVLTQIFDKELNSHKVKQIRFWISTVLFVCVSFYNVFDFDESILYPLIASAVSLMAVIAGISLRIRIYLYQGVTFFIVNSLGVLIHVIVNQPPASLKLIIGIVFLAVGLIFTGSFILFQMKREQILAGYSNFKELLSKWD